MYATGLQRWVVALTPVLVFWRLARFVEVVRTGPIDHTPSGGIGFVLYPGLLVTFAVVFVLTVAFYGLRAVQVWEDEPPDLRAR